MSPGKISDYEILEKIGSGSYSTVFRGRKKNQTANDFVAIKCVEKASLSKTAIDNIINEIRLLKTLRHKHIVEMKDFLWDEKFIYIILEWCNGGDLSAYIKQRHALSEATCKYFLRQLALALQYMRNHEISHFDLKPQNLLLQKTSGLVLKVADFGFAQHLKLGEENTTIKGSPQYMAPEILLKQRYDATVDLWSIGVILYECLIGKAPFSSPTFNELLEKIKYQKIIDVPPSTKISTDCRSLLDHLLQRDLSKRITFEQFFTHPLLDLEHAPSEENLAKAFSLFTQAVSEDVLHNYSTAYEMYCKGLCYLVPCIGDENDAVKKNSYREHANKYLIRAETIKHKILMPNATSFSNESTNSVCMALAPSLEYKQLYALCSSSPDIRHAMEIGRKAELYAMEMNYELSLKLFRSCLAELVRLLNAEPIGLRRNLLHQQVQQWMKNAESIKGLLISNEISQEDTYEASHSNCCVQ